MENFNKYIELKDRKGVYHGHPLEGCSVTVAAEFEYEMRDIEIDDGKIVDANVYLADVFIGSLSGMSLNNHMKKVLLSIKGDTVSIDKDLFEGMVEEAEELLEEKAEDMNVSLRDEQAQSKYDTYKERELGENW